MIYPSGLNPYGANTFLEQEVEVEKRRRTLKMLRDAGFGAIRQQFPWAEIEPDAKGRFWDEKFNQSTWDKYDNIVALAREHGIEILARLDTAPRWAHPSTDYAFTPPDNPEDFGDFVYAVASRYRGQIRYYQIWNEPNLTIEWGRRPVNAAEFLPLLRVAYQRIKQADPEAIVVAPALAPTLEESPNARNDLVYLGQLYDLGAAAYFDVMAVQAYGLRAGPDDRRLGAGDVNFSRPLLVRELMVERGDGHKPIWATEMGWNALPRDAGLPPVYGQVSEEQQARYTARAFERARQEWPWMGRMFVWFFKRADERERDQPMYYFRMVDPDFTPRPVYWYLASQALSTRALGPGLRPEDDWGVTYRGDWQSVAADDALGGRERVTQDMGASFAFDFYGTDLAVVHRCAPDAGRFQVVVDGAPANRLPRDREGRAWLDLSCPQGAAQQFTAVATLLPGRHHAEFLGEPGPRQGTWLTVDGFRVEQRAVGRRAFLLLPAALITVVAFGLRRRRGDTRGLRPSFLPGGAGPPTGAG